MLRELLLRTRRQPHASRRRSAGAPRWRRHSSIRTSTRRRSSSERRPSLTRSIWRSKSCRLPASIARALEPSRANSAARCCAMRSIPPAVPARRAAGGTGRAAERKDRRRSSPTSPLPYDLFIVGAAQTYSVENPARSPYSQHRRRPAARRLRKADRLSRRGRRSRKDVRDARSRASASRPTASTSSAASSRRTAARKRRRCSTA